MTTTSTDLIRLWYPSLPLSDRGWVCSLWFSNVYIPPHEYHTLWVSDMCLELQECNHLMEQWTCSGRHIGRDFEATPFYRDQLCQLSWQVPAIMKMSSSVRVLYTLTGMLHLCTPLSSLSLSLTSLSPQTLYQQWDPLSGDRTPGGVSSGRDTSRLLPAGHFQTALTCVAYIHVPNMYTSLQTCTCVRYRCHGLLLLETYTLLGSRQSAAATEHLFNVTDTWTDHVSCLIFEIHFVIDL